MNNSDTKPCSNHIWTEQINTLALVCRICKWRKDRMTGKIYPPQSPSSEPLLKEE